MVTSYECGKKSACRLTLCWLAEEIYNHRAVFLFVPHLPILLSIMWPFLLHQGENRICTCTPDNSLQNTVQHSNTANCNEPDSLQGPLQQSSAFSYCTPPQHFTWFSFFIFHTLIHTFPAAPTHLPTSLILPHAVPLWPLCVCVCVKTWIYAWVGSHAWLGSLSRHLAVLGAD